MLMAILFHKVDKGWHVWVKVFISFFNFKIRSDIFLNSILSIVISFFIVIINKMRIVHHIFQEMRSENTSTNKYWLAFNNLLRRCSKFMFELCLWTLMLHYSCVFKNYRFFRLWFYKIIKCIIGGFHIHRSSFRLIKCRPIIPLIVMVFWFKGLHVLGWLRHNLLDV